jgi:hypothetical protein
MRRLDHVRHYVEDLPAFDQGHIDLVRSCGHAAARKLGLEGPHLRNDVNDGRTKLMVIFKDSTSEDRQRISERGSWLIQEGDVRTGE